MKEFTQAYLYWEDELVKLDGYLVNKQGEVLGTLWNSKWTEPRILKIHYNQKGYCRVKVKLKDKSRLVAVHRIVASTFIKKPKTTMKLEVNHKDKNRSNNHVDNLEWKDHSSNVRYSKVGLPNPHRKLSPDEVRYIRKNYIKNHPKFGSKPLSEKFGISQRALLTLLKGETYKDVK